MASVAIGVVAIVGVALPTFAEATPATPPFKQCLAAGQDASCGVLITINPNGTATVSTDPSQAPMNGTDGALVGIVNNSNAVASSVALAGTGIFAFDGHGVCAANPTPCFSPKEFGPTGYEGPGTSFSITDANDGTVSFAGGMSPGTSTYFSLQSSTFSVPTNTLLPDISLSTINVSAQAQSAFSQAMAVFTDGASTAPPADFSASINWGDGSTSAGTVFQLYGTGTPFVVLGGHTYTSSGTFTIGVTITDTSLALNTASGTGTATVTGGTLIVCSPSGCQGSVNTPTESDSASTNSTTGSMLIGLNGSPLNCGDMDRHAPQTGTITDVGLNPGQPIDITVTFPRADLVGPANAPLEVCYESNTPFLDLEGAMVTLGLLPMCGSLPPHPPHMEKLGPCISYENIPISVKHKTVTEKLIVPPGDPKHR